MKENYFGKQLKMILFDCGMKQKDLAKIMNTTEACVSRWINGKRLPKGKTLQKLLDIIECHLELVPNERR